MRFPTLIVEHDTERPARDFQVAAALASRLAKLTGRAYRLVRMGGVRDAPLPGETCEHVTAEGALTVNGWLWVDRAEPSLPRSVARLSTSATLPVDDACVISINRRVLANDDVDAWCATMRDAFPQAISLQAFDKPDRVSVQWAPLSATRPSARADLHLDPYGRLRTDEVQSVAGRIAGASPAPGKSHGDKAPASPGPAILVIGESAHHAMVYPAVGAAIGDAADALGRVPTLRYLSGDAATERQLRNALREIDGLLLPGGSDLGQVKGQIAAATMALADGIPTLGLCLGMQTMVTALAREMAGWSGANLEEADPRAPALTFRRLEQRGVPFHRLGLRTMRFARDSVFRRLYEADEATEHVNHRYILDRELATLLEARGLELSATGAESETTIVDGISWRPHAFYIGVQGHPEQSSRRSRPHPLVLAWLRAALAISSSPPKRRAEHS